MHTVIAYKLFRVRKNGTLGPLFCNRKQVIPTHTWLNAECHPVKGLATRPGWHATAKPLAPHLKPDLANGEHRVWCLVALEGVTVIHRHENQGGLWYIAEKMKVLKQEVNHA